MANFADWAMNYDRTQMMVRFDSDILFQVGSATLSKKEIAARCESGGDFSGQDLTRKGECVPPRGQR